MCVKIQARGHSGKEEEREVSSVITGIFALFVRKGLRATGREETRLGR